MGSKVSRTFTPPTRLILLAGLAGGIVEVIWIGLYSAMTSAESAEVARQVTVTLLPGASGWSWAPMLGIAIHLLLSLMLAAVYVLVIWQPLARRYGAAGTLAGAVGLVLSVWAINFLIVLPYLNAKFVGLLPYAVTLVSKTLFGVAMALTVRSQAARAAPRSLQRVLTVGA